MCLSSQGGDWECFEKFFSGSFSEGQVRRELRLSPQERVYILSRFPFVKVFPLGSENASKSWYLVTIRNKE